MKPYDENGYVNSYDDIPNADEVVLAQGHPVVFVAGSLLLVKCKDINCHAVHVLAREEEEGDAPFLFALTIDEEMLFNLTGVMKMIKERKQQ